jgi:hypothetical protein
MSCPSLHRKFNPQTGYSKHPIQQTIQQTQSRIQIPKQQQQPQTQKQKHNLDLASYSFDEILQMFDLTYHMTLEDLKRAKRKVLMSHPDKSNLPPDYFLFYKRAFELVVNYHQSHSRQSQIVNEHTSVEYVPITETDIHTKQQLSEKTKTNQFQQRFNELFEQNMAEKPDPSKNEWFRSESTSSIYETQGAVSASNLNSSFESIKSRQREQGLVRYSGIRELSSFAGGASSFYDSGPSSIGQDENEDQVQDIYVSSDPFSKLKFEDLRKVHKDQTVFAVSESDYANVPKYKNVDQYSRERSRESLTPMEKQQAQRLFDERERIAREQQAKKQHLMELRMQEYAEKNKKIMGAFLHLENGR